MLLVLQRLPHQLACSRYSPGRTAGGDYRLKRRARTKVPVRSPVSLSI